MMPGSKPQHRGEIRSETPLGWLIDPELATIGYNEYVNF